MHALVLETRSTRDSIIETLSHINSIVLFIRHYVSSYVPLEFI